MVDLLTPADDHTGADMLAPKTSNHGAQDLQDPWGGIRPCFYRVDR